MTKQKFLKWMEKREGKAGGRGVFVEDNLINKGKAKGRASLGIRYVNGKWQVYAPQERSSDYIYIETADENVAFDTLAEEIARFERVFGEQDNK